MPKSRKNKRKPKVQKGISNSRFNKDLIETLTIFQANEEYKQMSSNAKKLIFGNNVGIQNPVAGNDFVNNMELKKIGNRIKQLYRERYLDFNGTCLSNYQLQLLYCFCSVKSREIFRQTGDPENKEGADTKEVADKIFKATYSKILLNCFKAITQFSTPDKKYYGINVRSAALYNDNPSFELVCEIYGIPPQKKMIAIEGNYRPVYRLAKPNAETISDWISIDANVIVQNDLSLPDTLPVFIQAHALKRLRERLDLLNSEAINYLLWENLHTIEDVVQYKTILLIPFSLYKVTIGYFVAEIIDKTLVLKTFLFITHNCTPEGDMLKELSGLGKRDISYWKIDRLSTFVNLETEKYPQITKLFSEAGLAELFELQNKKFSAGNLQKANLDGLSSYIQKGKNQSQVQEEEFNDFLKQSVTAY